jgi:nucleoid DNA-binding protein
LKEDGPLATTVKLFAWVSSAGGMPDHTWVTTYDNRNTPYATIEQVAAAGQSFWYCWGRFHIGGGSVVHADGLIGETEGNLEQALCLVEPNADSRQVHRARGAILRYGRDGVCHQLANQVLYASGIVPPLTVVNAWGYGASDFIYGTYGLNIDGWRRRRDECGARRAGVNTEAEMSGKPDDFEARARDVLGGQRPDLFAKLLGLRAEARRSLSRHWTKSRSPSAEELNASNQEMLDRAAQLLGPEHFEQIFGFRPNQRINLVDPKILGEQTTTRDDSVKRPVFVREPVATVTLRSLAATLAAEHNDLSKKQVEAIIGGLVGTIVKHLKKGQRVRIGGLGILQVQKRAARMGRNPATGNSLEIKAGKKVAFRASKDLKDAILRSDAK